MHSAATVLLLREQPTGLEVLMMRRGSTLSFMAGMWVFPGGRVEPEDGSAAALARLLPAALERCAGLHSMQGEPIAADSAAGLYVAACREAFEEAGVLLAVTASGEPCSLDRVERLGALRQTVARDAGAFDAFCIDPSDAPSLVAGDEDEIHIVGGINPSLRLGYFIDLVATLHAAHPHVTIKAFSAVELAALAEREKMQASAILHELKNAGLGMLPGGGAEIFSSHVRKEICPGKATADQWLDVHRAAHKLRIPSNSTMLYGHIEASEDRVDHLLRLRQLQDETGGFVAHVPLPYLPVKSAHFVGAQPNGILDLRQIALARLMLDNIPHIKAYWRALGTKTAQVALRAGADDLDGTVLREKVMESAGSDAPEFSVLMKPLSFRERFHKYSA